MIQESTAHSRNTPESTLVSDRHSGSALRFGSSCQPSEPILWNSISVDESHTHACRSGNPMPRANPIQAFCGKSLLSGLVLATGCASFRDPYVGSTGWKGRYKPHCRWRRQSPRRNRPLWSAGVHIQTADEHPLARQRDAGWRLPSAIRMKSRLIHPIDRAVSRPRCLNYLWWRIEPGSGIAPDPDPINSALAADVACRTTSS